MVGAGVVLDYVQHWKVFDVVDELFILVPSLLGLKGSWSCLCAICITALGADQLQVTVCEGLNVIVALGVCDGCAFLSLCARLPAR